MENWKGFVYTYRENQYLLLKTLTLSEANILTLSQTHFDMCISLYVIGMQYM